MPMWLLAYGSLMLWAGFRLDTGRNVPLAEVLHMPSGWFISGPCLAAGVICGTLSAMRFAEAENVWHKKGLAALFFPMSGVSYVVT